MSKQPTGFADLADLPEDERLDAVAHYVCGHGLTAAVCMDDIPGRPERYARKLRALGCRIISRSKGPVPGVITLKVGPANVN